MQAYSNPKRESDPYSLPDIEVWQHTTFEGDEYRYCPAYLEHTTGEPDHEREHGPDCDGWYWQARFPGCLPDSDPVGPFKTKAEALADAREGMES